MPQLRTAVDSLESRLFRAVDLAFGSNPNLISSVAGEDVPIRGSFVVVNNGDTATGGTVAYRAVLTHNSDFSGTLVEVGTGTIPAVGVGSANEQNIDFEFAVPSDQLGENFFFGIILDPANAIAETDETNNRAIEQSEVQLATTLVGDTLTGSSGDDSVEIYTYDGKLYIAMFNEDVGNTLQIAPILNGNSLTIRLLGGDDFVDAVDGVARPLYIECGEGDDYVHAGDGADVVFGGPGDDKLLGNDGNDLIDGNDGRDLIYGGDGDDDLAGNAGSDKIFGGIGNDTIFGNGGRDILHGQAGNDRLIGGKGDDVLSDTNLAGDSSIDTLSGNAGEDFAYSDVSDLLASIEATEV